MLVVKQKSTQLLKLRALSYLAITNPKKSLVKKMTNSDVSKFVIFFFGDPDGNRTRVTAVKGRCLSRLTTGPLTLILYHI